MPRFVWMLLLLVSLPVRAEEVDIFGKAVGPQVDHHAVLALYTNRGTRTAATSGAEELALRLAHVPYTTLVRIDLRGVPFFLEGMVRSSIRDGYAESAQRSRDMYQKAGLPSPDKLGHQLVMVADANGASHAAQGLAKGFDEALAIVFDADGREVTRGSFPREMQKIEAAMRGLSTKKAQP
jgi:hypothetical protein